MKLFFIPFLLLNTTLLFSQETTLLYTDSPNSKTENASKPTDKKQAGINLALPSVSDTIQTATTKKPILADSYTVSTLAGQNIAGSIDGYGQNALLSSPAGVAVDAAGTLYVADAVNNKIRKITPNGQVTTFAGKEAPGKKDGNIKEATFYHPTGVAIDAAGNLYVADKGNHQVRKITPLGIVSTLAGSGERNATDGFGSKAGFDKPVALAVDAAGNVYVADAANNKIRKITADGIVSTLAGSGELGSKNGKGAAASFYNPSGIAVDIAGNVYVADYGNNRIRKITPDGTVSTIAGSDAIGNTDGNVDSASFFYPTAVAVDVAGNVYVTDQVNHKIRKLSTTGEVTTLAGSGTIGAVDGAGSVASFNYPAGIAVDLYGNLYIADQLNCKIRKLVPTGNKL